MEKEKNGNTFTRSFFFSKQITENRCLQRCLDVSIELMRQINDLWEPLQRLGPLFNINTKADFLVNFLLEKNLVFLLNQI